MSRDDTIVSIATAKGIAAIGIVRISGSKAFEIAKKIFRGKIDFEAIKSHTVSYGKIIDLNQDIIDEVIITKMKSPKTFTREDVVEINCHGGNYVMKKIVELVTQLGGRIANPGEFTIRAFLSGRIDLCQSEAIVDIINSLSQKGAKAAINQLQGNLSCNIKLIRGNLIDLIANMEVIVDYPEEDFDEIDNIRILDILESAKLEIEKLITTYKKGKILREGIEVAIIGRPNVGKSSILNKLVGHNKAIVTEIPGTTRDSIEEYIDISGIPVKIIDTAGIRNTEDVVEKIGVDIALNKIDRADLILLIIDASSDINEEDKDLIEKVKEKTKIIVANKIDLVSNEKLIDLDNYFYGEEILKISVKKDFGFDNLEKFIERCALDNNLNIENEVLITNLRHKELLEKSICSLQDAINAHKSNVPTDLLTIDIKNAAYFLGEITGESVADDVLKNIFSKFCLGK